MIKNVTERIKKNVINEKANPSAYNIGADFLYRTVHTKIP
jgi:hypothetical protein